MAERFLRVLNSGGNQEYARHLAPYEKVLLAEDGNDVVVLCSPMVTEQEVASSVIPPAVLDLLPPPEVVELPAKAVKVGRVARFEGEGTQRHRFRVVATNGEILAQSEGYARKRDRDNTAGTIAKVFAVEATDE